jgi:hypothetical protein
MTSSGRNPCLLFAAAICLSAAGCMSARVHSLPQEEVLDVDTPSVFLTCASAPLPPADRKSVGPRGDRLQSGGHELNIPRSALTARRPFTLEQAPGDRVAVIVNRTVPPVSLERSAIMFIDFSRCSDSDVGDVDWHVWRMDRDGAGGEKLRTVLAGKRALTFIDGTSVYMIAN